MSINFPINQFDRHALFIRNQFFLHIEDRHIVYQVFVITHGVYFLLLHFLYDIQAMDTIEEKHGKYKDER